MKILENYDWENWLTGMWAAVVGGAANAATTTLALNVSDPGHQNYQVIGTVFLSSAATSFLLFLKQNPFPKQVSKTSTTVVVTQSGPEPPPPPVPQSGPPPSN